jgi:hypothetical protein
MDFYFDIGMAVLLRILRDRRELRKYRSAFLKLAAAIQAAFESDPSFTAELSQKVKGV